MMKATIQRGSSGVSLLVEGGVAGPWVAELEGSWNSLMAVVTPPQIRVELTDVTFIDDAGKALIAKMARAGAQISAKGCMTSCIVNKILERAKSPNSEEPPSNSPKGPALIILIFLLLFASLARAQEKPPMKLDLRQAVSLALRQNPQVQIAALDLAESQQDSAVAFSGLLPRLNFNVSDSAIRSNIEANLGFAIPGFPEHAGPFQVFETGATLSVPVFDLSLWRQWQSSRKNITSSDEQRQGVREQITLLTVSQYIDSLRAAAEVQASQSRVTLAQALYDQSVDLQKHGVATSVDTLRADVELQNEKQGLIIAQTNQKIALYGLSKLLNLDPKLPLELDDQTSFFKTPDTVVLTDLAEAYRQRPEMLALLAQEKSLSYNKSGAKDSRLPSLAFDGTYEQEGLSSSTIIPTYVYTARIEMPLFTGGRIHAQITRDDLELKKISQRIEEERNQIALEVQTAEAQLDSARSQVQVANLGVSLAQEEIRQARDRFQAGVADNIEVVTAQDALARANENQISALYQYNQSRADLAHAMGRIEMLYTK